MFVLQWECWDTCRAKSMVVNWHYVKGRLSYFYNMNGPFPFHMKFEKIQNRQKYHHSLKEHPMFSKIAKFGCEML